NDFIAVVDLGKSMNINKIELDALQDAGSWIFLPTQVIFEGSKDGIEYKTIKVLDNQISPTIKEKFPKVFSSEEKAKDIRFVRITAKNLGVCPKGHTGEGQAAWLFISEIVIE
ncbi:MAG: discoidin domain-containing protein, partial [Bacteroidales bacterium]|nr:discoidin domain-containing protein [Bacteroidales bacterium]